MAIMKLHFKCGPSPTARKRGVKHEETSFWFDTLLPVEDVAATIDKRVSKKRGVRVSILPAEFVRGVEFSVVSIEIRRPDNDLQVWDEILLAATGSRCPE